MHRNSAIETCVWFTHLVFPAEGLEAGEVLGELDDELHGEDGHLGHVLEEPVRLRLGRLAAHRLDGHVVHAVQVLLRRVLVLVLCGRAWRFDFMVPPQM